MKTQNLIIIIKKHKEIKVQMNISSNFQTSLMNLIIMILNKQILLYQKKIQLLRKLLQSQLKKLINNKIIEISKTEQMQKL